MNELKKFRSKPFKVYIVQFRLAYNDQCLEPKAEGHAINYKDEDSLPPAFFEEGEATRYVDDHLEKLKDHKDSAWIIVKKLDGSNGRCEIVQIRCYEETHSSNES